MWIMKKEGLDPKGNPFKEVEAKNEPMKAAFEKYGFKATKKVETKKK